MAEIHRHWRVGFPQMPSGNDGVMIAEIELFDETGSNITASRSTAGGDPGTGGGGFGSDNPLQAIDGNAATNAYWGTAVTNSLLTAKGPGVWLDFGAATPRQVSKIRVRAPDYDWAWQYWPPRIRVYWADNDPTNHFNFTQLAEFLNVPWPGQNGISDYLEVQAGAQPYESSPAAVPIEYAGALARSFPVPLEFRREPQAFAVDALAIPIELLQSRRIDAGAVPIAWGGVLPLIVDISVPVSWGGYLTSGAALPIEYAQRSAYDVPGVPLEVLREVNGAPRVPLAYGGYVPPFLPGSAHAWRVPHRSTVWHVRRSKVTT